MQLGGDRVQGGLVELAQVGTLRQVSAEQPVGVLVAGSLPGLGGSQKDTWTPVATVNLMCSAIPS
jgi:hypothetical protein